MTEPMIFAGPGSLAAKQMPHTFELHGVTFTDDYFWMRQKDDADLLPYLQAENELTVQYMLDTELLQATLYAEMRGRILEEDASVPARKGRFWYYTRTEAGKQYKKYCRRRTENGAEQIILDVDELAANKTFFQVGNFEVSPDGNFLAYTYDEIGFRQYTLVIKDLRSGEILPDTAERVTSVEWAGDSKTLFYTTEDATTKRSNLLFRHVLAEEPHHLIYEEKDELFLLYVTSSRTGKFIYRVSAGHTTSETSYLDADDPLGDFKLIAARQDGVRYEVSDDGVNFYLLTNSGAKNFRLMRANRSDLTESAWHEVVAHRSSVLLEGMDIFADYIVLYERESGLARVRIQDARTQAFDYVAFPEPVYEVSAGANNVFKTHTLRLQYQSMVTPASTYDYDMKKGKLNVRKVQTVRGYDASLYRSERIWATASDGKLVPISLVYKGDAPLSNRPLHLYGYGAYGYGMPTTFNGNRLSLLDRGVVFAIAHIRGGNELGEVWHDEGKMQHKKNTFTDFIACAEHLIEIGYTGSDRLTIEGRSAGGLLMGAVLNMRPDLFKAAFVGVPFLDVINTMLDEMLPLTTGEFVEWGNPKNRADFEVMRQYSPYDNIVAQAYPAIMVDAAFHDSQVPFWEAAKYVAALRATKTDNNPLLLQMELGTGGHGGQSGRFDYLKDVAKCYAFLLKQLGIFQ